MKTEIRNFRISASENPVYTSCPWDAREHNRYTITITNKDNGKKTRFYYYTSVARPEMNGVDELKQAFDCFLSDSECGAMDFREFCGELCYDEDSRKAFKIWRACVRSLGRLQDIGFDMNDIGDFRDELNQ